MDFRPLTIEGACLCGGVTWTSDEFRDAITVCFSHEQGVQKHCGSDRALTLFLPKLSFLIQGPVQCYTRTVGGRHVHHYWCATCGTTIGHEKQIDNERIHINANTLTNKSSTLDLAPPISFDVDQKAPFDIADPVTHRKPRHGFVGRDLPWKTPTDITGPFVIDKAPAEARVNPYP